MAAILWTLGGCAPSEPLPPYMPLAAGNHYGYFEEQLSNSRFRVGYDAPLETGYTFTEAERRREVDRKIAMAYDMALLRAAELARARGFEGFLVSNRENNVQIEEREEFRGPPFSFYHPYWNYPYYAVPYYAYPTYMDRVTEIAVSVDFVADLTESASREGAFDATEVIERLSRKYSLGPRPSV